MDFPLDGVGWVLPLEAVGGVFLSKGKGSYPWSVLASFPFRGEDRSFPWRGRRDLTSEGGGGVFSLVGEEVLCLVWARGVFPLERGSMGPSHRGVSLGGGVFFCWRGEVSFFPLEGWKMGLSLVGEGGVLPLEGEKGPISWRRRYLSLRGGGLSPGGGGVLLLEKWVFPLEGWRFFSIGG
ncbi:hypothetical protein DPMN_062019 [Dreissena polymorpha]|uniref:Uncharacterized protein n=1 Tax=Dreissena polymorpha TaxID=45954 RepID=A0A9D4C828_DREPO|nr:hypothetical protein DPMN_062019 [Dreissena polymorpha]